MEANSLLDTLKQVAENKLGGDFVLELFKCCFTSQKVLDICRQHLKYHYLQSEPQKKVLQALYDAYDVTGKIPTIGMLGQSFIDNKEVLALLNQIKRIEISTDMLEPIIDEFEEFIKKSRFLALYNKTGELYNQGKREDAITEMAKESAAIVSFKLKEQFRTRIFKDFEKRQEERKQTSEVALARYCIWGIHELDDITRGIEYGRSALIMARSGTGKSTMMKWVALANARMGKRVLHFQAEGTEVECNNAYDAAWTGSLINEIEMGAIPAEKQAKIKKAHRDILASGGEIIVHASEQFDSMSIEACRDIIVEELKLGAIDLIIFDYLPKFTVAGNWGGEQGERRRRLAIGDKMTNIATEFKAAVVTAVQADDVKPSDYNKVDFVMKRGNIAEVKAQVDPFSYFISVNMTDEEYDAGIARLWLDKARKCKAGRVIRIHTAFNRAKFYDSLKTIQNFYQKNAA